MFWPFLPIRVTVHCFLMWMITATNQVRMSEINWFCLIERERVEEKLTLLYALQCVSQQRLYLIDWVDTKQEVWKHILMSKTIRIYSSKYWIIICLIPYFVSNNYMICDNEMFYKTIFSKIAIKIKHGKLHFHCLLFGEACHTSDHTTKLRFSVSSFLECAR